ncbi:hypothetical protein IQ273_06280 [Nodosilinea sp. LEGE 07298]|uniref:hypothetical protein n=1 Tax=Nodosilinea sp. LEGE 07298 TaxID=2777970 RepID=UPI00187E98A3|nr:hypothetical protein [Nodosilinea sp. LEGE 07298]MBE9109024.1 hypothetical protein [Nodosilinea sp. LEGE 07298]
MVAAQSWSRYLIPYRRTHLVFPVSLMEVERRFASQFQQEIMLTRRSYRPVRYQGQLDGDHLLLIGPWANKRWRLRTAGTLEAAGQETRIHLTLQLSMENILVLLPVLIVFCIILAGIGIVGLWPLSWLYFATIYSFHYEANKVQELLTRIVLDQSLEGLL